MKLKGIIINYFVPLLMLFFFARNIVLVETDNLDSWMGGGMRMFGTIDKMLYRVSGFNVEHNNKLYFVNLRAIDALEDEDVESRILPNNKRLSEMLQKIKNLPWCYDLETDAFYLEKSVAHCDIPINPNQIKNIEVYKVHFDNGTKAVSLKLINSVND